MQNGSIAEARARAFLLDRFWVLERSVDVQGVDFLIQRRTLGARLHDRTPPRLGVVQVKYVQSEETNHYIAKDYVCNQQGEPFGEFFVLVHSGGPGRQRTFLLRAAEVCRDLALREEDARPRYFLPGRLLIRDGRFEVTDPAAALDTIEQALELAEFRHNRDYIGNVFHDPTEPSENHIEPDYRLPIAYVDTDVAEDFYALKLEAREALTGLESLAYYLREVLRATDPLSVEQAIKEFAWNSDHKGTSTLSLPVAWAYEHMLSTARRHQAKVSALRASHRLDSYLRLCDRTRAYILEVLEVELPMPENSSVAFSVTFRQDDLAFVAARYVVSPPKNLEPGERFRAHHTHDSANPGEITFGALAACWSQQCGPGRERSFSLIRH